MPALPTPCILHVLRFSSSIIPSSHCLMKSTKYERDKIALPVWVGPARNHFSIPG
jgi:hypothetical protein